MDNARHKTSKGCVNFIYTANISKLDIIRMSSLAPLSVHIAQTAQNGTGKYTFHLGNKKAMPYILLSAALAQ